MGKTCEKCGAEAVFKIYRINPRNGALDKEGAHFSCDVCFFELNAWLSHKNGRSVETTSLHI